MKKELSIEFKVVVAKCKNEKIKEIFVERRRIIVEIPGVADALDNKIMVHVGIERFYIIGEEEPIRMYGLILNFMDEMKCIFDVRRMFVGEGLKKVIDESANIRRLSVDIRDDGTTWRAGRMRPRCARFMYFRK